MLLIILNGCLVTPDGHSGIKPDLIIDKITYNKLPSCYETYPPEVICGGPTYYEFTLTIMNIGRKSVYSSIFVLNTKSRKDFVDQYFSSGELTNT